jgi:protein-S-isoprenylcysteine O-methyltransferase Ste14
MLHFLKPDDDAAMVRIPPPLVFIAFIVIGFLFDKYTLSVRLHVDELLQLSIAATIGLVGAVMIGVAFQGHLRTKQNPEPWKSTPKVLTDGVYGYSRNPMYVGMAIGQLAVGAALGNIWIVLLVPASMYCVYLCAIRHEETYLLEKFGQPFAAYMSSVRRWF